MYTQERSAHLSDLKRLGQTHTYCNFTVRGSPHLLHSESVTFPALKNAGTHLIHLGRVE